MITPADHLAERLAALAPSQRDEVRARWRMRSRETERIALELSENWDPADGLSTPLAGEDGWTGDREIVTQVALDALLASCHPDYGARSAAKSPLPDAVADSLESAYREHGWWCRTATTMIMPRRPGPHGATFDAGRDDPLQFSCAVSGSSLDAVEIVKLTEEDEPTRGSWRTIGALDCAVAPMIGSDELEIVFEKAPGTDVHTYRPALDDDNLSSGTLETLLDAAVAGGARVLVCPEYSLSPAVLERWREVLSRRDWDRDGGSRFEWVIAGTGPVDGDDSNSARLLDRRGKDLLRQPKTKPYDLAPNAWSNDWSCPTYGGEPERQGALELLAPQRRWEVLESRAGRVAVAICESIQPDVIDETATALGRLRPTLVFSPVFSKPTDDSRWERTASEYWGKVGTDVVVANSAVVSEWVAAGPCETTCAGWRMHQPPAGQGRWITGSVPARTPGKPLDALAVYPTT